MNAQPAIRGLLLSARHELSDNSMQLTVMVERVAYAAFAPAAGVPDADGFGRPRLPSVMLLACAEPHHPETDDDVMERAAFAFLDDSFARRTRPLSPALVARLRGLMETVGAMPALQGTEPTP